MAAARRRHSLALAEDYLGVSDGDRTLDTDAMRIGRAPISRRGFIGSLGASIAVLPGVCLAQFQHSPSLGSWRKIPSIVIMSTENDARLVAAHEAVAFWNAALSNLGSPFRLGSLSHAPNTITDDDVRPYSDGGFDETRVLYDWTTGSLNLRERVGQLGGDVVIVLSSASRRSFSLQYMPARKVLVVIEGPILNSIATSNWIQNVIAHELGHVIGLNHNNDESSLMCGSGARCRFARADRGFLPLTRGDKIRLLEMYPPGWNAS